MTHINTTKFLKGNKINEIGVHECRKKSSTGTDEGVSSLELNFCFTFYYEAQISMNYLKVDVEVTSWYNNNFI